jgi:hypothetical protein
MDRKRVVMSEYMIYRAQMRCSDTSDVETIVRYSEERYFDTETHRMVAVGHSRGKLVIVPYDETEDEITPVTIHPCWSQPPAAARTCILVTRQQIRFRVNTGRFVYG